MSFKGGIAGALDALEGRISKQTADRLRKEAGVDENTRIPRLKPHEFGKASKDRFHTEAEFLIGLVYGALGYIFFRWFEFQARRRGTLEAM